MFVIIGIVVLIILAFATLLAAMNRYRRCPSDKIMVVYGKVARGQTSKCIHGGAAFVWPLFQACEYLDLTPMTIDIGLKNALSNQNIRVDVPSRFTIGISTNPTVMTVAAERLLSMSREEIEENAKDIIFGQLRATIATMSIEEINAKREKFEEEVMKNVESELEKLGLKLINVNITDISDESGYIEALGKKAAAEAINKAKVEVAQQERDGKTGEANAQQQMRVNIAEAEKDGLTGEANAQQQMRINIANAERDGKTGEANAQQKMRVNIAEAEKDGQTGEAKAQQEMRVNVANANAEAIKGENTAKVVEAKSNADRREAEAEAERRAVAAEKTKSAEADTLAYIAEKKAEDARADREKSTRKADVLVPAEIEKEKLIIESQAIKEQQTLKGQGEGAEIRERLSGEAAGIQEILKKKAEGFAEMVKAANGDAEKAAMLLIVEQLPEIVRAQAEAISNIKFDKVVVWDGGGSGRGDGSAASSWLGSFTKMLPAMHDVCEMAGISLPEFLGKIKEQENAEDISSPANPPASTVEPEQDPE